MINLEVKKRYFSYRKNNTPILFNKSDHTTGIGKIFIRNIESFSENDLKEIKKNLCKLLQYLSIEVTTFLNKIFFFNKFRRKKRFVQLVLEILITSQNLFNILVKIENNNVEQNDLDLMTVILEKIITDWCCNTNKDFINALSTIVDSESLNITTSYYWCKKLYKIITTIQAA